MGFIWIHQLWGIEQLTTQSLPSREVDLGRLHSCGGVRGIPGDPEYGVPYEFLTSRNRSVLKNWWNECLRFHPPPLQSKWVLLSWAAISLATPEISVNATSEVFSGFYHN